MSPRFALAQAAGAVAVPDAGPVLLLRPPADMDLGDLLADRVVLDHGFKPAVDAWAKRGVTAADASPVAAVVTVARARALTLDLLAQAIDRVPKDAPIVVDGAKSDGVEAILKACRAHMAVGDVYAKAHGKCFAFPAPAAAPDGWADMPRQVEGFQTRAGVFSADGIDPGSRLLAAHLGDVRCRVCDLGAGWGYLSRHILANKAVTDLALVEAEARALDCARVNVADPRASYHWVDGTDWQGGPFDWVITNPPFHTGRKGDPGLGQAFLRSAARLLAPQGRLRLVANRHLPYEAHLATVFGGHTVLAEAQGYKVIEARNPRRKGAR
ncbi:MAG: methyltransferase [Pseudomonadota bacterium]